VPPGMATRGLDGLITSCRVRPYALFPPLRRGYARASRGPPPYVGVMLRSFLRHRDFLLGQDDPAAFKFVPRMSVPVGFDQPSHKSLNRIGASAVVSPVSCLTRQRRDEARVVTIKLRQDRKLRGGVA
jgi:hypothetical protein